MYPTYDLHQDRRAAGKIAVRIHRAEKTYQKICEKQSKLAKQLETDREALRLLMDKHKKRRAKVTRQLTVEIQPSGYVAVDKGDWL